MRIEDLLGVGRSVSDTWLGFLLKHTTRPYEGVLLTSVVCSISVSSTHPRYSGLTGGGENHPDEEIIWIREAKSSPKIK
jgi:hypothetical protein